MARRKRHCVPASLDPAELNDELPKGPLLLVGDGVPQVRAALLGAGRDITLSRASGLSDAAHVARLAAQSGLPGPGAPPPRPLYLRPPDVTLPASGR